MSFLTRDQIKAYTDQVPNKGRWQYYRTAGVIDNLINDMADSFAQVIGNTRVVAKSGGDYTSIQAAIDSITDATDTNRYTVVVNPGVYTENVTLKNYVNLIGLPDRRGARIYSTGGTLLTLPDTEAHLSWIDLYMEPTADSDILIDATAGDGSTGFYRIEHADITMSFSTSIKPKLVDSKAGVGLYMINDTLSYYADSAATTGTYTPILLRSGNNLFYLLRSILRSRNGSASANIENVQDNSTGRILKEICTLQVTCTNAAFSGYATPYAVYGGHAQNKQFNNVVVECYGAGSGDCYVCYLDSDTNDQIVNTSRNIYDISGFSNNYRYYIGSGDTIYSYFNRHITDLSDVKIGALRELDIYNNDDFIISEKVGIGTSAPDAAVHIQDAGVTKVALDRVGGSGRRWDLISNSDGSFSIYDYDGTATRMSIDPSGLASFSAISGSHDDITATSEGVAASILTDATFVTTNGDSDLDNVTLADGTEGQTKTICCVAEGNAADTWKITPANMVGGTQITFSGAGEGCILKMYSAGWVVVGNNGGTIS